MMDIKQISTMRVYSSNRIEFRRVAWLLAGIVLLVKVLAAGQSFGAAGVTYLEDRTTKIGVDELGRIVHLENKADGKGNIIDKAANSAFDMVCRRGTNWEDVVQADRLAYRVAKTGSTIRIETDRIVTRDATSDVSVVLSISLTNGVLTFGATIHNEQTDLMVTDFVYPKVGVIKTLGVGKPDLLWPNQAGEWYHNVGDVLSERPDTRESPNRLWINYPGNASMQWMSLVDGDQCLYFSGRDDTFYSTILQVNGSRSDRGAITLAIDRLAFVKTGEKWTAPNSVLQLYTGSWRRGAEDYREWASIWRKVRNKPEWVKNMMGYFLVINKQQYGDEMWGYDKLPYLYEKAREHGFDVLGLFGWYHSGHDNQYPDIHAGESLGGAKMLKENIGKVKEAGGNVTLYYQGHLMDVTSDYYKKTGHRLESKSIWGVPYYEKYNKSHASDFLRAFTSKTFSTVCPSSVEWHDLMTKKAAEIAELGPSGILYDQIGGMPPNPCFDESHDHLHDKPSLSYTNGRLQLLDKIYNRTKDVDPEYAFLTEHITDVYSQFADCLHGIGATPSGNRQSLLSDDRAGVVNYPELFRYCFPETIITVRNPFPFIRPQVVNYATAMGLSYELELRYLDDCRHLQEDRTPEWKKYAADVTALRKKYWEVLGHGVFIDEELLRNHNPVVISKAFQKENRLAVVLWNDTGETQDIRLEVPGYSLDEVSTVSSVNKRMPGSLASQHIAVALYTKK
jgi:hypothetical protein